MPSQQPPNYALQWLVGAGLACLAVALTWRGSWPLAILCSGVTVLLLVVLFAHEFAGSEISSQRLREQHNRSVRSK